MKEVEINIKNRSYYFPDDMINIKNFHWDLLKIEKKSHENVDMHYISYITIKKLSNCENIHIGNPLYLITLSVTGHFKEKYGEKYLIIDLTEKYEEVFSGIKSEIKAVNGGKELFYGKNYAKIGVNTEDHLPLDKKLKFLTLKIIIRYILQKGKKLFPHIYLDKCLYKW